MNIKGVDKHYIFQRRPFLAYFKLAVTVLAFKLQVQIIDYLVATVIIVANFLRNNKQIKFELQHLHGNA